MRAGLVAIIFLGACASGGERPDAAPRSDGIESFGDGSGPVNGACPAGQLATNVDAARQPTCMPIDSLSQLAIGEHCSAFLGWRDSCDACTTPPAKWGRASTASCSPGVGTGNTCTIPELGGTAIHMFGLDLEGDMDGNDKLYAGLHCSPDTAAGGAIGPCPAGQVVDGFNGTGWTCGSFASVAIQYVQQSCSIYLGWQDSCDGCTTVPAKWGYTSDNACTNGAGADSTCLPPAPLGTDNVRLFGLNTDGDVDDNDKFHVALRCDPAAPATTMQTVKCPAGQFVSATLSGNGFRCDSPGPGIASYFAAHCTLYFGWHDGCDGCVDPPTKWGKVRASDCANGAGANNTCTQFTLDQPVTMFGLDTDGNVDSNDTFYVGFRCD